MEYQQQQYRRIEEEGGPLPQSKRLLLATNLQNSRPCCATTTRRAAAAATPRRRCSLRFLLASRSTTTILIFLTMMRSAAAWSSTSTTTATGTHLSSRRQLLLLASRNHHWQTVFTKKNNHNNNHVGHPSRRWTMMCTDSRELRFLSGGSSTVLNSSSARSSSNSYARPTATTVSAAATTSNNNNKHKPTTPSRSNLLQDLSQTYSQVFSFAAEATTQPFLANNNSNNGESLSLLSSVRSAVMANSMIMSGGGGGGGGDSETTTGNTATLNKKPFYFTTSATRSFTTLHGLGSKFEHPPTATINNSNNSKSAVAPRHAKRSSTPPPPSRPPQTGYGASIQLTDEERDLFRLLRRVRLETGLGTTLRVAGGWVRDKLLATPEFQAYHKVFDVRSASSSSAASNNKPPRLTSKFRTGGGGTTSLGRQGTKVLVSNSRENQPVDIDIALDDMLGREFADHLNEYLSAHGKDEVTVGMVLKNPEKSKHLETATMKVASFWIDFVNLRAEEYTQDSRIPDLMRIGTAQEDAFRRDLTINALFYNINTGQVEDWTGRGFQDLRKGVIATPLPPLTTLLDDPLRVLRSIRFAARLRFTMDGELIEAAKTGGVGQALSEKVSRERVGGELDLMLRSPDPVGAVRLLINLKLVGCVFPVRTHFRELLEQQLERGGAVDIPEDKTAQAVSHLTENVFQRGLHLLTTAHDHLADCRWSPPVWCLSKQQSSGFGATEMRLIDDEEARRLLWYAAFLKPLYDDFKIQQAHAAPKRQRGAKKANRCIVSKILVDELKRPGRDAEAIQRIMRGADDFSNLIKSGSAVSATMILLSGVHVAHTTSRSSDEFCDVESGDEDCDYGRLVCFMNGRRVDSTMEEDPVWHHAMEFRLEAAKIMRRVGPLWRAALFLSIAEELVESEMSDDMEYTIEGDVFDDSHELIRQGVMERFDAFAAALQQVGVIGIWEEKPLLDGDAVKRHVLPRIPRGPAFRDVMDVQMDWMTMHPGGGSDALETYLRRAFPDFVAEKDVVEKAKKPRKKHIEEDGSWL